MSTRWRHFHTFLAQIVASSISVVLTIVAARTLESEALGYLAVAMAVQALAQGLVRAFAAEPVLFSHASYQGGIRDLIGPSTTTTLLAGFVLASVALVGYVASGQLWLGVGVAVSFIPTFMQDYFRTVLFIQRRGLAALLADAVGLVALCGCLVWAASVAEPFAFLIAWGAGAAVAAIVCACIVRPAVRFSSVSSWVRQNGRDGGLFTLDFAVTSGLNQVSVLVVAAVVGATGAAALRGAQVLITPVSLVLRAGIAAVAPAIVSAAAAGARVRAYKIAAAFSVASLAAAGLCVLWVAVPDELVALILGDSAGIAVGAVVAVAFAWGATGVAIGPGLVLRATGRLASATLLKVIVAPVSAALLVLGAFVGGASGSQTGLAIGEGLRGALAWRQAIRRQ